MSQAIQWIKSNVLIVICLGVIVLSVISLAVPTAGVAASLKQQIDQREQAKREGQTYLSRSVKIPSRNPGEAPQSQPITVNDAAVAELRRIFDDMNDGYKGLEASVVAFNQRGPASTNPHLPLLDGLLPKPSREGIKFLGKEAYKNKFLQLYKSLGNDEAQPGLPPTAEEIKELADSVTAAAAANGLAGVGAAGQDNAQLNQELATKQVEFLSRRASQISIYCPPTVKSGDQLISGVFDIDEWAQRPDEPTMTELWHGQVNAWIQQDLIAAVRLANYSEDAKSVLHVPVKRLIGIEVVPGYIGLTPRGGMTASVASTPGTLAEPVPPDDLNQPLRRDFRVSHTGRRSNSLYDVRHANISLIVDARQLPRLLNAFGQVNLMTPIVKSITSVDQAAHLREGYIYGNRVDVVQVDLLVESLWLRRWTAGHNTPEDAEQAGEAFNVGLMPDAIRYQLSLPTRDPNFQPTEAPIEGGGPRTFPGQFDEGMPFPGGPGMPGMPGNPY